MARVSGEFSRSPAIGGQALDISPFVGLMPSYFDAPAPRAARKHPGATVHVGVAER
jgi:hypothetical protein